MVRRKRDSGESRGPTALGACVGRSIRVDYMVDLIGGSGTSHKDIFVIEGLEIRIVEVEVL